ncbi:MAG: phosphoribosyltransferase family protein [Bosea sp. (in: a-proteobacteria)]|uniref:phosphoribosyltransferase family protein n=1 Tax=Bosea sp. (in: a-proteobacteria) TaxID=1871050 RepID=UPI0027325B35|nr:phosphoribosyltransferase family protein [Bosea sp. (in: a-proteobacteria)]MDP3602276.1 phosphoribosyltransferase family protein [Bosea sp. (in: a-proteobacteria)]
MERITTIAGPDGTAIPVRYRRWKNHPVPGVDFPDISPLATDAQATRLVIDALGGRLSDEISVVAGIDVGIDVGGLGLAGALAYRNGLGLLDIRKVGAIRVEVIRSIMANYELGDGVAISQAHRIAGRTVAVVDDCLMSGQTALAAVRLLRRLGGRCDTAMFVFEIEGMPGRALLEEAGIAVHSLQRLPQADPDGATDGEAVASPPS